ncbi:lys-63-specific deubiquitinase BRCC36 [Octopus sinensis]|uniref:Lys-63-specific deubiquitinase BRCC36 n=1 Tax=Octopus sinensis TaxID=2607531 RepID=A0A6P7TMQ3_9MOLL|nr:lys-63-specific deubiquitinase BRCC36 [Octopus sinensis]
MAAVVSVQLESAAYLVCLTHALSTEREEVMGLLLGEIDEKKVAHISAVIMLRRSDKQADRVEISPEQLSAASIKAEELAIELKQPLRVLGWYHSHPHITVWPSHVDVQTQAMYQMMEPGFIGLIFSVFNEDKNSKQNKIQTTCFQSRKSSLSENQFERIEIPLNIVPSGSIGQACLESLVDLPRIISQEEDEAYQGLAQNSDMDLITKLHNASVYSCSLALIMEVLMGPLMQTLEARHERNLLRIQELTQKRRQLLNQIEAGT